MSDGAPANNDKRGNILDFLISSFVVIIVSLILSIVVEWLGMIFLWEDEGSMHSLNMLTNEVTFINEDFSNQGVAGYNPAHVIDSVYQYIYGEQDGTGWIDRLINWLNEPTTSEASFVEKYGKIGVNGVKEFMLAAVYVTLVFTIRLSILFLSLPLFVLVGILALIDGLAKRDVRRWENGRESGFRYHYAKKWIAPSFFVTWIIYLSLPFSVHPNFVVLPLALLMGFTIRESASWFKKYL